MIPDTNNLIQPIGLSSRHNKSGPACGASWIFEAYCAWRKLASTNWQSGIMMKYEVPYELQVWINQEDSVSILEL